MNVTRVQTLSKRFYKPWNYHGMRCPIMEMWKHGQGMKADFKWLYGLWNHCETCGRILRTSGTWTMEAWSVEAILQTSEPS